MHKNSITEEHDKVWDWYDPGIIRYNQVQPDMNRYEAGMSSIGQVWGPVWQGMTRYKTGMTGYDHHKGMTLVWPGMKTYD